MTMNTEAQHGTYEAAVDRWPLRTVVVEDSPMMLKTLSLFLERQGDTRGSRHEQWIM